MYYLKTDYTTDPALRFVGPFESEGLAEDAAKSILSADDEARCVTILRPTAEFTRSMVIARTPLLPRLADAG